MVGTVLAKDSKPDFLTKKGDLVATSKKGDIANRDIAMVPKTLMEIENEANLEVKEVEVAASRGTSLETTSSHTSKGKAEVEATKKKEEKKEVKPAEKEKSVSSGTSQSDEEAVSSGSEDSSDEESSQSSASSNSEDSSQESEATSQDSEDSESSGSASDDSESSADSEDSEASESETEEDDKKEVASSVASVKVEEEDDVDSEADARNMINKRYPRGFSNYENNNIDVKGKNDFVKRGALWPRFESTEVRQVRDYSPWSADNV